MLVYDNSSFKLSKRKTDRNGFLRVDMCNITKASVNPYLGREIPNSESFGLEPEKIYYVLRPAEELQKAVESFNNLPLLSRHIEVDVENVPKKDIVGSLGDKASFEYPYIQNSLIVYDKKDIDLALKGEKKELSCGYRYTPIKQSGVFEGQPYDFVMTDIIGNHVAIVKEGRAGHDVMIADSNETIKDKIMKLFKKEVVMDEFNEADHPRDKDGRFTKAGSGSGSEKKEERGTYENFKSPIANKIGNWYGEQGEESADKARAMREMEWTLHKLNTEKNDEEKEELKRDIDWEMKKFEERFGEKPEKYGFKYEKESEGSEKKEESSKESRGDLGSGSPRHIFGQKKDGSVAVALKTTNYPNWNKVEVVKEFEKEDDALNYAEERGEAIKSDYQNKTKNAEKYGVATWVTPKELEHIKEHSRFPDNESKEESSKETTNDAIPDNQDKPEKAGEEALTKGETEMEETKEVLAEDKCAKDKDIDKRSLIDEIGGMLKDKVDEELWRTIIGKIEKIAYNDSETGANDEDLEDKEEKVEEKTEEKSEELEDKKEEKAEEKEEMAKDEKLAMDIDAIKEQARQEVMADFKAREVARKEVRSFVGDVNVMSFDSAEEIYKFACEKAGLNLQGIASYKDVFVGLSASKGKRLAMDASPVSGSDEECFKNIRVL